MTFTKRLIQSSILAALCLLPQAYADNDAAEFNHSCNDEFENDLVFSLLRSHLFLKKVLKSDGIPVALGYDSEKLLDKLEELSSQEFETLKPSLDEETLHEISTIYQESWGNYAFFASDVKVLDIPADEIDRNLSRFCVLLHKVQAGPNMIDSAKLLRLAMHDSQEVSHIGKTLSGGTKNRLESLILSDAIIGHQNLILENAHNISRLKTVVKNGFKIYDEHTETCVPFRKNVFCTKATGKRPITKLSEITEDFHKRSHRRAMEKVLREIDPNLFRFYKDRL